jgi:protein PhnA
MSELSPCPKCACVYTYELGELLACPECGHEWMAISSDQDSPEATSDELSVIKDTAGNILQDGDTVTVVKDLKVKGGPCRSRLVPRCAIFVWCATTAITISTAK